MSTNREYSSIRVIRSVNNNNLGKVVGAMSFAGVSTGYIVAYSSCKLVTAEIIYASKTSKIDITWFTSLMPLGVFFAAPLVALLCDKVGRKLTMVLSLFPIVTSHFLSTFSSVDYIAALLLGQLMAGMGLAFFIVALPIYLAEVAPAHLRGKCFCYQYAAFLAGIFVVCTLSFLIPPAWLSVVGIVVHAGAAASIACLTDSPRYLFTKNRRTDALRSLEWLRGSEADIEGEYAELEAILSYQEPMECTQYNKPAIYKPMILVITADMLKPLCGTMVFYIYQYELNRIISRSWDKSYHAAYGLLPIAANVCMSLVTVVLVDRLSRRFMLALSAILTFVTCVAIGLFSFYCDTEVVRTNEFMIYGLAATLYNMGHTLGLGPLIPLFVVETLPLRVRAHVTGVAMALASLVTFTLAKVFMEAIHTIHIHGLFWTFGAGGAILAVFIVAYFPDFKQESLEEIELYFENGTFTRHTSVLDNSSRAVETRLCESTDSNLCRYD